ncbi:helix-turn-helix transcriptional regulator [Paenibacillus hemerocallicola]|uniref:Helix-turn-helix transcriptional regulator n=1 Tax=Paenibacillus hemerocallicola TaxID=1172614 RepID=A0A5C4SVX4_9BACL|nr:helix-turn-helix domain-containing protein [Paenibacillus hemerocallicola]TNJ57391.1 helix-turn-helix transcriptional regulator [Paenibacillus hemerocallicola]
MKSHLKTNRLFFNILASFLSLLIPIIVIGFLTYGNFVAKLKADFADKMSRSLQSSAASVDLYLKTVQEVGISFFGDTAVQELLKPYSSYTLKERSDLIHIMKSLKRTGTIVAELAEDLFVYIDREKVYSASGVDDFDMYFEHIYKFERYGVSFWKESLASIRGVEILPPSVTHSPSGDKRVIPVVTTGVVRGNHALLVANVSVGLLSKTLQSNAVFASSKFVVLYSNRHILFSSGEDTAAEDNIGHLKQAFVDDGPGSLELKLGDTPYIASHMKSDIYGWEFYSLTPTGEFNKQAEGILDMIVTICAVLVVVGLVFSFIFAFRLYNPIRKIRDIIVDQEESFEPPGRDASGMNELETIGMGVRQLIRHNRKYQVELDVVSMEYMDNALLHLLQDREMPVEDDFVKLLREKLRFTKPDFICCSIWFHFKEPFYRDIQDVDRFVILNKLKKLVGGLLNEYVHAYVLEGKRHHYVCIVNTGDGVTGEASVRGALERFMETFRYDSLYCVIHAGIGRTYPGVDGLAKSYSDSVTALQHANSGDDFQIVGFDESAQERSIHYTFADEDRLVACLKVGDATALAAKIEEIIRTHAERSASIHSTGRLLTDMYNTGLRYLAEEGLRRIRFVSDDMHALLSDSRKLSMDYGPKQRALLEFFKQLATTVADRQQAFKSSSLVSTVMAHIETDYGNDLYLENISARMDVSSKYLSRIFKEKTGMNITDYINLIRIAKAKELLADSSLTIPEIAGRVGIYSRSTFLRIFKKMEGISPQDFRKSGISGSAGYTGTD